MKIVWEFGKFYDNKAQPPSAQCHWWWCGWWEASLFAEPLDRLAALQNCRDELATMERKYPISDGGIVGMIKLEIE